MLQGDSISQQEKLEAIIFRRISIFTEDSVLAGKKET